MSKVKPLSRSCSRSPHQSPVNFGRELQGPPNGAGCGGVLGGARRGLAVGGLVAGGRVTQVVRSVRSDAAQDDAEREVQPVEKRACGFRAIAGRRSDAVDCRKPLEWGATRTRGGLGFGNIAMIARLGADGGRGDGWRLGENATGAGPRQAQGDQRQATTSRLSHSARPRVPERGMVSEPSPAPIATSWAGSDSASAAGCRSRHSGARHFM